MGILNESRSKSKKNKKNNYNSLQKIPHFQDISSNNNNDNNCCSTEDIDNFCSLDYVVELIGCRRLPGRIDYLSEEVIFERKTEAQHIETSNLENVARMAASVKYQNQLVIFTNELAQ